MTRLHYLLEPLGVAGILGLGVLLFCVPFYLTAVVPAEHELETRQSAAERYKARSPYQPVSQDNRTEELRRFQGLFPPVDRLTDELELLYSLTTDARLELQQSEYRLEDRGPGLAAYRITLPINGTYQQVREFINTVLAKMPNASVDALRFERKKVGDVRIETQMRLTIYFRPQGEMKVQ